MTITAPRGRHALINNTVTLGLNALSDQQQKDLS